MDCGIEALARAGSPGCAGAGSGTRFPSAAVRRIAASLTLPSDAELMVLIQAGDVRAFELFYDRHVAVALRVATGILHDHQLAEDAVQDGFVGFWRGRAGYRPGTAAAKTWLLVIVSNRAIDLGRRERNRRGVLSGGTPPTDRPGPESTEDEAIAREDHQELCAQLKRLPGEQRRVIELAYFVGLTHAEIARRLGLPAGTVKGRLRLGRDKLRLALASGRPKADDIPEHHTR